MSVTDGKTARSTAIAGVVIAMIFGAGIGIYGLELEDARRFAVTAPVWWIAGCAVFVGVSFAVGALWMQGVDELAQRAHYVAWYWGGSTALSGLIFLLIAGPALPRFIDFERLLVPLAPVGGPAAGFMAGIMVSLALLSAGYLLWWVTYWARKQ